MTTVNTETTERNFTTHGKSLSPDRIAFLGLQLRELGQKMIDGGYEYESGGLTIGIEDAFAMFGSDTQATMHKQLMGRTLNLTADLTIKACPIPRKPADPVTNYGKDVAKDTREVLKFIKGTPGLPEAAKMMLKDEIARLKTIAKPPVKS